MNQFQKRAYRYEVLGDLAERIDYKINDLAEDIRSYQSKQEEESTPADWWQEEIEANSEKIKILETLKKDLEKL